MLENKKKFRQKNELRSIDLYRIVEHFIYILRKNHKFKLRKMLSYHDKFLDLDITKSPLD